MPDRIVSSTRAPSNSRKKRHPLYLVWRGMIDRCRNPNRDNWKHYGGRGITVCERWKVFESFVADMGIRPAGASLERIDNSGNYEPSNCRWATHVEQCRNTRRNRMLTVDGVTKCLKDWHLITGVPQMTILQRITRGWSVSEAVLTPAKQNAPPLTETDRPSILAMRASGMTIAAIAIHYRKDAAEMSRFISGKKHAPRKPKVHIRIADVMGRASNTAEQQLRVARKPAPTP